MGRSRANERREIAIKGIVQGVGFRPFVYGLALRHRLAGWVCNDADGVHIEVEGEPEELDAFLQEIPETAPRLSGIESVVWQACPTLGERDFYIIPSQGSGERQALIAPDAALCDECLIELFDPRDRRFRYPFINCTNCGPRFTITHAVPYDRASTTMAGFTMCEACRSEYEDPSNRRFHAQPIACPVCGPRVTLRDTSGYPFAPEGESSMAAAARLLRAGQIVAVKGLGGYHLACNPFDEKAVSSLRSRKARQDKPFALMATSMQEVRALCQEVSPEEEALLTSPGRPIVLLRRRLEDDLAGDVAPRQKTIGVMLAYTPLHHILLNDVGMPLVMTSGNRSDEPIAYRDYDALEHIGGIADYFLMHDRAIHMRCDDSVARIFQGKTSIVRRSRGFAPAPITLCSSFESPVLACGGELKNTFCLAKENHVFISHHIGDLDNLETLTSYTEGIEHYKRLFDIAPKLVACDLHPEYLSTKYAQTLADEGMKVIGVQHHRAHIASCLADNGRPLSERVIGVAMDGTGYGDDGTIWGGEFFVGSIEKGFVRKIHFDYAPLPGGEAAIRQPWRGAIARLIAAFGEEQTLRLPLGVVQNAGERNIRVIARMMRQKINCPMTSSVGRLFDSVAAIVGVPGSLQVNYEGQAAIELELTATPDVSKSYPISLEEAESGCWRLHTSNLVEAIVEDKISGTEPGDISAMFHRTMAGAVLLACRRIRDGGGPNAVALSGGAFQNALLFDLTVELLTESGFTVYRHIGVPTNDGGLSLGQAVLAAHYLEEEGEPCA